MSASVALDRRGVAESLRRGARWAVVGVVVVVAVAVGVPSLRDDSPQPAPAELARRDAAASYRAEIRPLLDRGASVVALGLKPGIADIDSQAYPPEVLTGMADGWIAGLQAVRADVQALAPAAFLGDVHWHYLRSLDEYVHTAEALRAAASAADSRRSLIELAASLGRTADLLHDRAEAMLDRLVARPTSSKTE